MRGRLAVATLLLTAFASGALAQSLAEAAAKERERRERERKKAGTAAKVVTDEQLGKTGGSLALDGSTGGAAATAEKPRGEGEDPPEWADLSRTEREERRRERAKTQAGVTGIAAGEEQRAEQETSWRDRARGVLGRIRTAQADVERLKAEKERTLGDSLRSTDTNEILRLRSRATELDDEIRQAEGELKDALDGQRELEDEARRAGVPPGWIREG